MSCWVDRDMGVCPGKGKKWLGIGTEGNNKEGTFEVQNIKVLSIGGPWETSV